ncbi:hypothetical protein G3N59_15670 [Paraburkholderia sp. Ac-20340]|uniref:hypothetical protein n=1 Tax=Paraburkholderia sp. Ac-20340 TaxID=2703888 RepID=UPI0019802A7A|nr:hypothetical protein [Paraburkholderia sp. Ac-20340]MBN3854822.1 hypothetical protein [Paraburkholderia sp. Ac-20340]
MQWVAAFSFCDDSIIAMPNAPSRWEPYCHRPDAAAHLSNFAGSVLGHHAGVIFFDGSGATRLKSAIPDNDGDTTDLVVSIQRPPFFPVGFAGGSTARSAQQNPRGGGNAIAQTASRVLADLGQARSSAAQFVENHKTAFDGAATAVDVLGVLSGVVAMASLLAGTVALAPAVLGIVAGAAALALLSEDGRMFYYEVTGNELRKRELASSWHYQMVEAVAPWLALPDLALSGLSTVREAGQTARTVAAASNRIETTTARLASQREAIDAYSQAHATKLNQSNITTKIQRMRAKANKLDKNLLRAQSKLTVASRKLVVLRTIGLPAYAGTIYGMSVYGIDPPSLSDGLQASEKAWHDRLPPPTPTPDPHHPAQLLVPAQTAAQVAGIAHPMMQFQVAVRPKTEVTQ